LQYQHVVKSRNPRSHLVKPKVSYSIKLRDRLRSLRNQKYRETNEVVLSGLADAEAYAEDESDSDGFSDFDWDIDSDDEDSKDKGCSIM